MTHTLSHLLLARALCNRYSYHAHFTDKKTEEPEVESDLSM